MTMTTRRLLNSIAAATIALMCTAAQARASAIQLVDASELSAGGTVATFPGLLPNPFGFDLTAGAITLTFSTPGIFTVMDSDGVSFDFAAGTTLLANNLQSGPLTINFSTGVREVGLFAQSLAFGEEKFTFDVFHGAASPTTFSVGPANNNDFPGVALFIGARATGGDLIMQLTIGEAFNNDFVVGPITFAEAVVAEPVPEPTSILLLGTGLLYGARRLRRRAVRL